MTVTEAPTTTPPPGPGLPRTFTISSTKPTVTKFRYGWSAATTEIAATGTTTRSATVTLAPPKYGSNILYVSAIDTTLNQGHGSWPVEVSRPAPPVARWRLDSYPGVTQAQALQDVQAASGDTDGAGPLTANTPLSSSGIGWTDDIRMVGAKTATFNTINSSVTTAGPVVDTTKSYSVAAWVRLSGLAPEASTIAGQDGNCYFGFFFGYQKLAGVPRWNVTIPNGDCVTTRTFTAAWSDPITAAHLNRWQHLAFSYDQADRSVALFINGVQVTRVPLASTPWNATGGMRLGHIGFQNAVLDGALSDVQVFDRVLVEEDFVGQQAEAPLSGGVHEPGFLNPVQVGDWDFSGARSCYEAGSDPLFCQSPEAGQFGRRLALTQGSFIGYGHRDDGLLLDNVHFAEDPGDPYHGLTTTEYGLSQKNTATEESPVWQDTPVLRTDDSYAVSVWARPDDVLPEDGTVIRTVVAQAGEHQSSLWMTYVPSIESWYLCTKAVDGATGPLECVGAHVPGSGGVWTHVIGTYDRNRSELRIYVNGQRAASHALSYVPFSATKRVVVGRAFWQDELIDQWAGGIDDLRFYQGALTDAGARELFADQSVETVEP